MPLAPEYVGGRRHPFAPRVRSFTLWFLVGSWAPFTGLVMALADPHQQRSTFLASITASWGLFPFFSLRFVIAYAAARKAFAARTRLRAIGWLGAGGAVLVLMLAPSVPGSSERRGPEGWDVWGEFLATPAALAAAWYAVLAAFLYGPVGRSSDEQRDIAVALVGLWLALPPTATHFSLTRAESGDPSYQACAAVVRMTHALFGHGRWFGTGFPDFRGLGGWIHSNANRDVLLGLQLVLAIVLPCVVAIGALLRILARRWWVRRVENGRISGWALLEATAPGPANVPILTGDGRGPIQVLARMRDVAAPYREAEAEPVAIVASSGGRGSRR